MLARRDTRREASRLRRLSPLQTLENQSQTWGIRCHSCTGREGLPPSWKLSYKTYVLRFTRESKFSFNQRIARILMSSVNGAPLDYKGAFLAALGRQEPRGASTPPLSMGIENISYNILSFCWSTAYTQRI